MNQPYDRSAAALPPGAPGARPRGLTPDADPSAEMEALRLRRVRRAFAGPTADDGRASPLTRGLLAGVAVGVLAMVGTTVGGVVEATWRAAEEQERQRNQPATTVAPGTTAAPATRSSAPAASTTRRPTAPSARA